MIQLPENIQIIVVGGGISGLGIATELGKRGFEVLLLEKGQCGQATSANSLGIIHGGFRYLQGLEISRVITSIRDQDYLLREWSACVKPLCCSMPLKKFGLKSRWPATFGALIYNCLKRKETGNSQNKATVDNGSLYWYDAQISDQDLFVRTAIDEATSSGAQILESIKVESVKDLGGSVSVQTDKGEVACTYLIDATGPWLGGSPLSKAFNLVFEGSLDSSCALGVPSLDGRLFFLLNRRHNKIAVGTFYLPFDGDPEQVEVSQQEIDDAIAAVELAVPDLRLSKKRLLNVEKGIIPVKSQNGNNPVFYGSEQVTRDGNVVKVLSTKLTSFKSQAERVADLVEGL